MMKTQLMTSASGKKSQVMRVPRGGVAAMDKKSVAALSMKMGALVEDLKQRGASSLIWWFPEMGVPPNHL